MNILILFLCTGVSGTSMGGVHSCMVAALYPGGLLINLSLPNPCVLKIAHLHGISVANMRWLAGDLACTPLLAPRSAAIAFCHGALKDATAWQALLGDRDSNNKVEKEVTRMSLNFLQYNMILSTSGHIGHYQGSS